MAPPPPPPAVLLAMLLVNVLFVTVRLAPKMWTPPPFTDVLLLKVLPLTVAVEPPVMYRAPPPLPPPGIAAAVELLPLKLLSVTMSVPPASPEPQPLRATAPPFGAVELLMALLVRVRVLSRYT